MELNLDLESDANLIWQAGADCRVVVTKMQLLIPRITFNSEGQSLYASKFIANKKWTYLREQIQRSNSSTQRSGYFNHFLLDVFTFPFNKVLHSCFFYSEVTRYMRTTILLKAQLSSCFYLKLHDSQSAFKPAKFEEQIEKRSILAAYLLIKTIKTDKPVQDFAGSP